MRCACPVSAEVAGLQWKRRELLRRRGQMPAAPAPTPDRSASMRRFMESLRDTRAAGPACYACSCITERDGTTWVEGTAAVFDTWSTTIDYGDGKPFRELLLPGCFDDALARPDLDVAVRVHHDESMTLARFPRDRPACRVWSDKRGLHFGVRVPASELGEWVLDGIRTRRLDGCSFVMADVRDRWTEAADGTLLRQILTVGELIDVSLVSRGAYVMPAPEPAVA